MEENTGVNFALEAAAQDSNDQAATLEQVLAEAAAAIPTQEVEPAQEGTTGENTSGDADRQPEAQQVYMTQAQVDAAVGARIQAARNKVLKDNKPLLDKGALLEQYTSGMSDEEITEALQAVAAGRLAKDEGVDEKTARAIVRRTAAPAAVQQPFVEAEAPEQNTDTLRARIMAAGDYMSMVGDPAYTLETLRQNKAALSDFASGMSARDVYVKHFRTAPKKAAPPVERRGGSLPGEGAASGRLSDKELDRILDYVNRGGKVRF